MLNTEPETNLSSNKLHLAALILSAFAGCIILVSSCRTKTEYYMYDDFPKVPKTDIHLHIRTTDPVYMDFATRFNFRVVSPNVDSGHPWEEQLDTAMAIAKKWPGRFIFLGIFSADSFETADFAGNAIAQIDRNMRAGASGIKIWKNIGMVIRDKDGKYVMVDDPVFDPVFKYLEENKIPVMGHLGEPRNCWLPLKEMTDSSKSRYYRANPKYHMFLHPEAPSYEDQINARDNLLKKHPNLEFIGAHLASLEWNVDEIAKRMDQFPNLKIDMSARVAHLQYQSIANRERVRNFMIRYQDRIMYGTDITINPNESDPEGRTQTLLERWRSNWIYMATDSIQKIRNIQGDVKGLKLPKNVIDKIYNENADLYLNSQSH